MPVLISPGVYVRELDFSIFVEAFAPTVFGLVITAQTGPLNELTFVASVPEANRIFGHPNVNSMGMYALMQYLRRGNQAWVVRVGKTGANGLAKPGVEIPGSASMGSILTADTGPYVFAGEGAPSITGTATAPFGPLTDDTKPAWTGAGSVSATLIGGTIADGTLNVTLDGGGAVNVTVDLTTAVTYADVATLLEAAIDDAFPGGVKTATVTFTAGPNKFTIRSTALYGDAGSIVVVAGTGGTDLFALLGGTGAGGETTAGVDGANLFSISVDGDTAQIVELTGAALGGTMVEVVNALNGGTTGVTFANDGTGKLKVTHDVPGETSTLEILPIVGGGSAYAALGFTPAGEVEGTPADNVLSLTFINDGGGPTNYDITLGPGSLTATQVAAAIEAAIGADGSAEVIVSGDGERVFVSTTGEGTDSSVEVIEVDSPANDILGFPVALAAGNDAGGTTLTFAERDFGDTHISVRIMEGSLSDPSDPLWKVQILQNGALVSLYDNVRKTFSTPAEEANTFEKRIGTPDAPADPYITVVDTLGAGEPAITDLVKGDLFTFTTTSSDPSGFTADEGDYITGLDMFEDPDTVELTVLACPGQFASSISERLVEIGEQRMDLLALLDPPSNLNPQSVADWHNGTGDYEGVHAAFNSSYSACYWPWVYIYDSFNKQEVLTPPSGHVAAIIAYTDQIADPWFAPAGFNRGIIQAARRLPFNPKQGHRDMLQGGTNRVNCIVNFLGEGIVVFSQRTLLRASSQLANINVRRLLLVARKAVVQATRSLTFEPNDEVSWARFEALVNPFLGGIAQRRGLAEFKVVMNAQTTPPDMRDRNEARGIIFLRPTTTMEKILLDFVIMDQSVTFTELEELLF